MASYGKVVGGQFTNATIDINRQGELALSADTSGWRKKPRPSLTVDTVAAWEEIITERRGAMGAVSKVGQAVSLAALRGPAGKAAAAAVGSTADLVRGPHTVRVDWVDGTQSLIELPDKLFQHLVILLKNCQIVSDAPESAKPEPSQPGVVGQLTKLASAALASKSDVPKQIERLAALRERGALTEAEFAAKKGELLGRTTPEVELVSAPAPIPGPPPPPAAPPPPPPPPAAPPPLAPPPAAPPPLAPPPAAPPPLAPPPAAPPPLAPPPAAPPPLAPPPTWAPDPHGRHDLRYWDGAAWTEHVSSGGVQATDPA